MAVNIFKKAKAYRNKHPKISFQDAIQAVSGKAKVSGVKKKVSDAKKKVKRISGVKKTTATRVVSGKVGKIGALAKGKKIIADINRLENERKKLKTKIEKDFLALIINKEHDKLDALNKQLKR